MKLVNIFLLGTFIFILGMKTQVEAGTKIVECRYQQTEVPAVVTDNCSLYLVRLCKQVWYGGFMRSEEGFPDQTYELRCSNGKTIFKSNKDDLIKWYSLGGDVAAFLLKGKGYALVNVKTGKITQTDFYNLGVSLLDESPSPTNVLMWHDVESNAQAGNPILAYRATVQGTVGEAVPGSNMRRMASMKRGSYCDGSATSAALMVENFPSKLWSEKRRVSITGSVDVTPAGSIDENCEKFNSHLFIGKRRSDGLWQLLSAQDGSLFEPQVTYPTAETANADLIPALTRAAKAKEKFKEDEVKGTILLKEAAVKAAAEQEEKYKVIRKEVKTLQAKGDYEGAMYLAEAKLTDDDWVLAAAAWKDAPFNVIEHVVKVNEKRGNDYPTAHIVAELNGRLTALAAVRECEKIKPSQFELNGDFSHSASNRPRVKTWLEINDAKTRAIVNLRPGPNESLVYDYATDTWGTVYSSPGQHVPQYINKPTEQDDEAARTVAGQARVAAYHACIDKLKIKIGGQRPFEL